MKELDKLRTALLLGYAGNLIPLQTIYGGVTDGVTGAARGAVGDVGGITGGLLGWSALTNPRLNHVMPTNPKARAALLLAGSTLSGIGGSLATRSLLPKKHDWW